MKNVILWSLPVTLNKHFIMAIVFKSTRDPEAAC